MKPANRVLVVEDELVVQMHLQHIIDDLGHQVVGTAASAEEALELARRERPELVLMDIHLADGGDGVDTARRISAESDCAVIFITAYADTATLERAGPVAAAGYLVKPFSAASVRAAVATALASRGRLQRVRERERSLGNILEGLGEAILATDEVGRITFINPRACRLLGWEAGDTLGLDLGDVLRCGVESDQLELGVAVGRALGQGQKQTLPGLELRRRDGGELTLGALVLEPVPQDTGRPLGLLVQLEPEGSPPIPAAPTTRPARPQVPFGQETRLLVYSHDTFGLGHLQRCLKLIRGLSARFPRLSTLLVTGSPVVHRYAMPPNTDYVKLPALRKVGSEEYEARSLAISKGGIRTLRSNLLLRTIRDYDPNVLLVDHSPLGGKGELLPGLELLAERGGCLRILGLRDIIDEPGSVIELWRQTGVYDVLTRLYDRLVVYGHQQVFDPVTQYAFPESLARKTDFVGYVCEDPAPAVQEHVNGKDPRPLVTVTVGGGDGGAESVIVPFLEALGRFRQRLNVRAEVLTGPFVPPETAARLEALVGDLPVTLTSFLPSTAELVRRSDLVISTAGYNTVSDLLVHGRRGLLIPRVLHRQEQLVRARRLAELGLVRCLGPDEVSPERLVEEIERLLADPEEPLTRARAEGRLPLDGARRFAEYCAGLSVEARPD